MSTTEKQRVSDLIDDIVETLKSKGTLERCIGAFKGFAELDRVAREVGVEIYPLARTGPCTALVQDHPSHANHCNLPAIVNVAVLTTSGWLMNDLCPEHLKLALIRR